MSALSPINTYIAEIPRDDPCCSVHSFLSYSPSNAEVEEAEQVRKEEEDLRKVEEKKRVEIEEDW